MFIEELTAENDEKVFEFLAEKYNVPIYCVKRSISFKEKHPLVRLYINTNPDERFGLKEGHLAVTDFNFCHQDKKWDGEYNYDRDWMLFMYKIFGQRYLSQFSVYRSLMSHGLYTTAKPKERKKKIKRYDEQTAEIYDWVIEQTQTIGHVV